MSRIEKDSDTKEELQQLRGEVIKEIGSQRKKSPWLACSLLFVLLIVGGIGAAAWAIAATGLVTVPGFSQAAYEEPTPVRVVKPGVPIETIIQEEVTSTLATRLQAGGGTLKDASISLTLSEQSLTASLRNLLENSGDRTIDPSRTQLAVDPEQGFMFFLPFTKSASNSAVQLSVKAEMKDGAIVLVPDAATVGSLRIPKSMVTFFIQPFIEERLVHLNSELASFVQIREILYQEGQVVIEGDIAVKILEIEP